MAIDYMDLKGSKEKEDGLQVGELEPIPCQKRKLVHNLRAVHQNISQGLNTVEENCSSPAQCTGNHVFTGKHDGFDVSDLGKKTNFLGTVSLLSTQGSQLKQNVKCKPSKTAVLAADVHTRK